jgi:hypothetical protein
MQLDEVAIGDEMLRTDWLAVEHLFTPLAGKL